MFLRKTELKNCYYRSSYTKNKSRSFISMYCPHHIMVIAWVLAYEPWNNLPFSFTDKFLSYQLCSPLSLPGSFHTHCVLIPLVPGSYHTNHVSFPFLARFLSYQQCSLPFHCQVPFIPTVFPSLPLPGSFHTKSATVPGSY